PLGSRVVVYARVTMDGAPYPGAVVLWELKDPQGIRKDFGQATTNATGYATIAIFTSPTWPRGDYILIAAVSGTDAKANATITLQAVYISIIVPQPAYPLGSRVVVYARVTMDGAPYPGAVVLWELKDPQGIRKDFGQATTNATGYATIAFDTSKDWLPGPYDLIAAVSGTEARNTTTVYLKRSLAKLTVDVAPSSTWRGNNIVISGYVVFDPAPSAYAGTIKVYIDDQLIWSLSLSPDGRFSSPPFNTTYLRSGTRTARVELLETVEYFGGVNSTTFLIDRVLVTDFSVPIPGRVNANSTQTIKFRLQYESDNSPFTDAAGSKVWINGTQANYSNGWWYITYTANLGNYTFVITGVEDNFRTKSDRFWSLLVKPPSVVWDAIIITNWTILDSDRRVDVNSTQSIYIFAHYWYDNKPLRGRIVLNGTFSGEEWVANWGIKIDVTHASVAKVAYLPTYVRDYNFNLTAFVIQYVQAPQLIWDMVIVKESRVSKSRVDVESEQWAEFLLVHAYDGEGVTGGSVVTSEGAATHRGGGWWRVTVTSPVTRKLEARVTSVESQYGITVFRHEAPAAAIIFDRVVFEVSAPARLNVGTAVGNRLRVTAYYQYDRTAFEGSYEVTPSPDTVVTTVTAVSYTVTWMAETKYGLTKFVSTTAVVRYDRLIIASYSVDNNFMILEFVVSYESDKAPAVAEARVLAGERVLATLSTTREGVARFNYTPFLEELSRVASVIIEPVRSLEYEVTVGVRVEVPVKLLRSILTIDPRCQNNFIIKLEPFFTDGRLAKVSTMLEVEALERIVKWLRTGETLETVLRPGINTVTLLELRVEDTDVIVPNAKTFLGFRRAYNVALEMKLSIPTFHYTGYPDALLPGSIDLVNTGNVTLCSIQVVTTLERIGLIREGRIIIDLLPAGVKISRALTEFRIKTAYDVGVFNVTVTAYYEPGRNVLAIETTKVTFVKELPADLEKLVRERERLLEVMPSWDKEYFIKAVDEQVSLYNETGKYDPSIVANLLGRLKIAEELISHLNKISQWLTSLNRTYVEYRECMGLHMLNDELDKATDIWRRLRHEEAYQRMSLVYVAVQIIYERSHELARACSLAAPLPIEHGRYLASIIADAIRLALQNQTDLANQRLSEAGRVASLMAAAWDALRLAEEAIRRAEAEGRTWGLDKARSLLGEARSLFDQRLYEEAGERALKAKEAADAAVSPLTFVLPIVVVVIIMVVVGYLVYRAIRIRKILKS
ncbi:MAG: DUF4398 domain-containing protein, partial [Thermofilaceae archaeon]